jgi:ferric-dicitrate binding protein FerR (iron transport regulator)
MKEKIYQYLEGKLPKEGQRELLRWLKQNDNQSVFDQVKKEWWLKKSDGLAKDRQDMPQHRLTGRLKDKQQIERSAKYLKIYKYAAIALLMISLTGSWFFSRPYFAPPQHTEISTGMGQVSVMDMPDGSTIWINSGTKLSYDNQFGIKNREIKVTGEAFFSVARNEKTPFVVDLGSMKVEATGTRFGVSNYEESETMDVVLEEGGVNIHSANNKLLASLLPEEMAQLNKLKKTIEKVKVKPEYHTSWRNGTIHIFELPLKELVVKLERRYNQKFEVAPNIESLPYTFSIEDQSLFDVLNLLEKISPVKAVQKGDIITLQYEPIKRTD